VLAVTDGVELAVTAATCAAVPLLIPSTVTLAVREVPALTVLRPVRPVTVRLVAVALVTVPVTPLLKLTLSLAIVVSKFAPAIVMLVELDGRLSLLDVTVGTG